MEFVYAIVLKQLLLFTRMLLVLHVPSLGLGCFKTFSDWVTSLDRSLLETETFISFIIICSNIIIYCCI